MGHQLLVVDKRQLDGPIMRQVQRAPLRIIEFGRRKRERAGLRTDVVALKREESQVLCRIVEVAEGELPVEVHQILLARPGNCVGTLLVPGEPFVNAGQRGIRQQRSGGSSESSLKQLAARRRKHGRLLKAVSLQDDSIAQERAWRPNCRWLGRASEARAAE